MGVKAKKDTMNATEAKNKFGELLDFAKLRPMKIEKNGRPVAVVVSAEEYERLEAMEDAWWARQADEAAKEGFLGQEESEKFFAEMMNAKD
jgi:antitoxin Phd